MSIYPKKSAVTLLKNYAAICNKALHANKNRFPFKQILGAASQYESGRMIEVHIKGTPSAENFVMTLKSGRISVTPHGTCTNCACERRWDVSADYLQDVSQNPDPYIENPARIDWDWLFDTERDRGY